MAPRLPRLTPDQATVEFDEPAPMVCPSCGGHDQRPPTMSDDRTTTCPKCGHRFPVEDEPGGGA